MNKIISIKGELDKKGTVAYKLAVMAAKDGKNLKYYIESILENHVKQ
jgi:hypothetical protein